jgi:hypothetical protein
VVALKSKIETMITILQTCRGKKLNARYAVAKTKYTQSSAKPILKELVSLELLCKNTQTRTLKRRPSSWSRIGRQLHLLSKNPPMVNHDYYSTTELGIKAIKLWEELESITLDKKGKLRSPPDSE